MNGHYTIIEGYGMFLTPDAPPRLIPCIETDWPSGLKRTDSGWKFTASAQKPQAGGAGSGNQPV